MKKVLLVLALGTLAHFSNAQSGDTTEAPANDTVAANTTLAKQNDLEQLKKEVEVLKQQNDALHKQMKKMRGLRTVSFGNKISVSRQGSKQVVSE